MQPALSVVQSSSFDQFYSLYPRKEARQKAKLMWDRLTPEEKKLAIQAIPVHAKRWQMLGTEKHMIPLPASWLNPDIGRRWEDEIELPNGNGPWWSSKEGIAAEFKRRGKEIPPGKSWEECKAILMEARMEAR